MNPVCGNPKCDYDFRQDGIPDDGLVPFNSDPFVSFGQRRQGEFEPELHFCSKDCRDEYKES